MVVGQALMSGCASSPKVYPMTQEGVSKTNNLLVVECSSGVMLSRHDNPNVYFQDTSGLCAKEVDRRIKSGELTQRELQLDMNLAQNLIQQQQRQQMIAVQQKAEKDRESNTWSAVAFLCASRPLGC